MSVMNTSISTNDGFIDWGKLELFLKSSFPLTEEKMNVQQFSEGYSNLTFLLTIGEWEGILRRPPYGEVPKKAHDMSREFKFLSKIHPVYALAPKPLIFSEGDDIMDKHFYIMEKKEGVVIDGEIPSFFGTAETSGQDISQSLVDAIVHLQNVDYIKSGLEQFGQPKGFLERQVHGWIKRYKNSATDHISSISSLEQWLIGNLPTTQETTIVHNDFKLNNLVLAPDRPIRVSGVLDWELATIGDPLSDFGSTLAYWGQKGDPDMGIHFVTDQQGFYSRRELVESYAIASKRDMQHIHYYVSFGFYKLAVILQQIYYRWRNGSLKDDRFEGLNQAVANLIDMAHLGKEGKIV